MPPETAAARNPLGPIGRYVIENLKSLREERKLTYTELSARLEEIGRPIPTLGLSRIENGKRRVDADDLIALALALRVTPSSLLLPRGGGADDEIELSPVIRHLARVAWQWADGHEPLPERNSPEGEAVASRTNLRELMDFREHARPAWTGSLPEFDLMARIEELEKQVHGMRKGDGEQQ